LDAVGFAEAEGLTRTPLGAFAAEILVSCSAAPAVPFTRGIGAVCGSACEVFCAASRSAAFSAAAFETLRSEGVRFSLMFSP
jgi:hypothetical protein